MTQFDQSDWIKLLLVLFCDDVGLERIVKRLKIHFSCQLNFKAPGENLKTDLRENTLKMLMWFVEY